MIKKLLLLYFIVRSALDISPLILQKAQEYAIQQAKQGIVERLTNPFRSDH